MPRPRPRTVSTRARSGSPRTRAGTRSRPPRPRRASCATSASGSMGYTWEENGPALDVRQGRATPRAGRWRRWPRLPFVDVLYIRCDWRDVQSRPGRLDKHPVWAATFDAARRHGLRVGFRVQLSNPEIQPARLALPDFLQPRIPLVTLERRARAAGPEAGRAPLRPSRVPARVPRAERAARRRAGRRPARRVHGPDDVRLLGRGAHQRLAEPVQRSPAWPSARSWT